MRLLCTGDLAGHDDEFVAAQPRHQIALAYLALQSPGHGHQKLIAHVMAMLIVHRLEAVQVHDVDCHQALGRAMCQCGGQTQTQAAAIG